MKKRLIVPSLLLAAGVALAEEPPAQKPDEQAASRDPKQLDGMSILANQETPKALVIVPWKTSELGATLGLLPMLDDSRGPVDRDVFMRSLAYYEIRSETTRHDGAQVATGARRSQQ